ncbi:MAG: hypothetical protein JXA28_03640 [Bacteroidetes bacterium]|nr:hypothetical protein [Bacteroidota bacterium]
MRKSSKAFVSIVLAATAFLICSVQLNAQIGQKLVINRFVSDPDNIETHVVISDVDGVGPNLKITIYNEEGRLVYERYETLNAFGKINYDPLSYLNAYQHGYNQNPKFSGTVRIESDGGNIVGQYWEKYRNTEKAYLNIAVPAADGNGYDKLVCQHFVSDKSVNAQIIISNTEIARPVTIDAKFYSDNGGLVGVEKRVIPANGVISINPFKSLKGVQMTGTAYIVVVGAGKITGEYWQAAEREKYQVALPLEGVIKIR